MLNDLIGMILGAVHEYITPEYIPIVDSIVAPVVACTMLIFCCAVSVFFVRSVVHALGSSGS